MSCGSGFASRHCARIEFDVSFEVSGRPYRGDFVPLVRFWEIAARFEFEFPGRNSPLNSMLRDLPFPSSFLPLHIFYFLQHDGERQS